MENGKDDRRRNAQLLVGAILNWGGHGKDIAVFLGVSATTVSHWRGVESGEGRKAAIPTNEQIEKLIGILCYCIQRNLNFLTSMMHLGAFEHRTSVLLARMLWRELEPRIAYFKQTDTSAGPELDDLLKQLADVQEKGGPSSLRTVLNPITTWGSQPPDLSSVPDLNEPVDFEKIREYLTVGPVIEDRTDRYAAQFDAMLTNRARKKVGLPEMKQK